MTDPTVPMASRPGAPLEGQEPRRTVSSDVAPAREPTERILGSAEQCFCELGYDGTSVRTIAHRAGVSKSLVLYHFQSKERLYAEVQTRVYERLARSIRDSVAVRGGTVVDRGLVAFDALIEGVRERNDLAAQAMLGARALSSPALRGQVERLRHDLRRLLRDTTGVVLGDASLPVSLDAAADLLWAVLGGIGLESAFDDGPERTESALGAVRTLIEIGLRSAQEGRDA